MHDTDYPHSCEQAQATCSSVPKAVPTAEGLRDDLCKDDDKHCKADPQSAHTGHSNLLHSAPCCMQPLHFRLFGQSNNMSGKDEARHLEDHGMERGTHPWRGQAQALQRCSLP